MLRGALASGLVLVTGAAGGGLPGGRTRPLTVTSPSSRAVFRDLDAVAVLTARLLPASLTLGPGWLCR
jgi:hypothetical protein